MMMRVDLEHAPYLLACARGLPGTSIRSREINASVSEFRDGPHRSLERLDGRGRLVLIEQRNTEQMQALHIPWCGGLDGAQLALRRGSPPEAQHGQRLF